MRKSNFNKVIIIALAVLVVTTGLCIAFSCKMGSNIATMISGGLSAFATAILGVIAIMQNKYYNDENSIFLNEQRILMKQKNENDKRLALYNQFNNISSDLRFEYQRFQLNCSQSTVTLFLGKVIADNMTSDSFIKLMYNGQYYNNVTMILEQICIKIATLPYYFEHAENTLESFQNYSAQIKDNVKLLNFKFDKTKTLDLIFKDLVNAGKNLETNFLMLCTEIEEYTNSIINEKCKIEDIEKDISEKQIKRNEFIVKYAKEINNNGQA